VTVKVAQVNWRQFLNFGFLELYVGIYAVHMVIFAYVHLELLIEED